MTDEDDTRRALIGRVGGSCRRDELEAAGAVLLGDAGELWARPVTEDVMDRVGVDLLNDPDIENDLGRFVASVARHSGLSDRCRADCLYVSLSDFQQSYVLLEGGDLAGWLVTEEDGRPAAETALNVGLRRLGVSRGDAPDEAAAIGIGSVWGG